MKKFLTLCITLTSFYSQAQVAMRDLDINNVRATITNCGSIFNNLTNARYEVPKVSSGSTAKNTIYAAGFWIGGISGNQLYLAAETYRQNGTDLRPGPVSTYTSEQYLNNWNRIWKISQTEIAVFRDRILNGQDVTSYEDILDWPAKGNVFGADIQHNSYAPFVDTDSNGTYNPMSGDYPLIKGDLCLYTIMNDSITHTESTGKAFKVDIHRMVYAYTTNDALNNTVFVDYKIVNRSDRDYVPFVFSSWVDFDLGNYNDDYVGTDTTRNMIYAYNGDNNDEGIMGYGINPPAQACVLLNQQMAASMYYNNDTDPHTGNPTSDSDYYNYMTGLWRDGTPKTAAGNGYNTAGPVTNFSYSGSPCANTGWWESSAGITPGDRRILATITPQPLLQNGELEVSMAFVYARESSNIASVCALQKTVDSVVTWYQNGGSTGIRSFEKGLTFSVFPNPAKNTISIQGIETKGKTTVSIVDIMGRSVKTVSLSTDRSINISELTSGIYIVHVTTEEGSATRRVVIE